MMDQDLFKKLKTVESMLIQRSIRHEECLKDLRIATYIIEEILRGEKNG
jgi:hypothetical protein